MTDRQRRLVAACPVGLVAACLWHVAPGPVAAVLAVGVVAVFGWLLHQQHRVEAATASATTSAIHGVKVHVVDGTVACTAGPIRPRIFLGRGLLSSLDEDELQAVVLHERAHRTRFDPLRVSIVAAGQAAAPRALVSPDAASRVEARREIVADRVAIRDGATRRALAASLLKVGDAPAGAVGFVSAHELRVRALVDELPVDPPARRWLAPILGATGAASTRPSGDSACRR